MRLLWSSEVALSAPTMAHLLGSSVTSKHFSFDSYSAYSLHLTTKHSALNHYPLLQLNRHSQ
jgi:hypothetical protein